MGTPMQSIKEFLDQNGVNLRRETWDSWMKLQVVYWEKLFSGGDKNKLFEKHNGADQQSPDWRALRPDADI